MRIRCCTTLVVALAVLVGLHFGDAVADPCLTVYPAEETQFHYDPAEHALVDESDNSFDPDYAIEGWVLVERRGGKIAYSVYQAPGLRGFVQSDGGPTGFRIAGRAFQLIIDGFSNRPVTFENVTLVVETQFACSPGLWIDGVPVEGGKHLLGDLSVSTPSKGNNYSDVLILDVVIEGCGNSEFWAFADEDGDGERDGGECFSAFGRDFKLPVLDASWSALKGTFGRTQ